LERIEELTMPTTAQKQLEKVEGKPAWKIAKYLPTQGHWNESDYLAMDRLESAHFFELVDGYLEFLPMPSMAHQRVARQLFRALDRYCLATGAGEAFYDGTRAKLREGEIRLPDIVFVTHTEKPVETEDYLLRADLIMEVVSKGAENRDRDLNEKRVAYARAGVKEYWIVDPALKLIKIFRLNGSKEYKVHGEFKKGQKATSVLLKGFEVDVTEALTGLKQ
jgi:Uma2 family endonuclease